MLDHNDERPATGMQGVNCAYCHGVMESTRPGQRFCRPSCRASDAARRRAERELELLALIERASEVAATLRRTPRRRTA